MQSNHVSNSTMPIQELPVKVHEVDYLGISWCHIFILVGRLLYLKLLHGLAFICKHTSYEYGIDSAIERTEQRILHIFFANIPESYYRLVEDIGPLPSITYPVVVPGSVGPRPGSSIRVLHSSRSSRPVTRPSSNDTLPQPPEVPLAVAVPNRFADYNRETIYAPAALSPAVRLEPFLKGRSIERSMEIGDADNRNENNGSPVHANGSAYATPSDSVYSSIIRRTVSGGKSRPTSQSHSTAMHTAGMATASEYAQILDRPQFSDPDRVSPSSDSQMLAARPREEHDEMEGQYLRRSRSMESFPGRFPISDGLEYTAFATVHGRVNGRTATSVRPFSEL